MIEFKLPSLGADMDQGKLLEWKVKPGDQVKRGDIVAVVDTSKAAVDVESWQEGTVHKLLAEPGETLPVGAVMAILLEAGETPEQAALAKTSRPTPPAAPQPAAIPAVTAVEQSVPGEARRRISPAARKHADELGIDINTIAGSGPQRAVTLEDVEHAAAAKVEKKDRSAEMRRAIAAAMASSKRGIPHYYLAETIPLEHATSWLMQENANRPVTERLLMAVLFLKAVALAAKKFPEMNGFYIDDKFQPAQAAHVGVAISVRAGGLIAPAIHSVEEKSLTQLMADLSDLVQRTRAGSLRSSEMSDPTITVTNLGDQGVESVLGVIYPPQVALVGFGKVTERPWAVGGVLKAVPVVTASLAADHRVSDGHRGGLFLAAIRELLQEPEKL